MSSHPHPHHEHVHPKKKLHRNWLFTFAGILMIIAMLVYVLTLDESAIPTDQPVTAPANP